MPASQREPGQQRAEYALAIDAADRRRLREMATAHRAAQREEQRDAADNGKQASIDS